MKKLRVGIIGVGMAFERLHYPAYEALADRYEIVALCDLQEEKAQTWAGRLQLKPEKVFTDYRRMLEEADPDVVDIMVPIELNYTVTADVAGKLAGQRKGIICEKPLAPNMEQAKDARNLAQKYNLPIMIAENYRYSQETNILRDLIRNHRVGEVLYFIQNRALNFPQEMYQDAFSAKDWRQYPEYPAGVITDTAVHELGSLRHIFGPIAKLQAFGRPQKEDFAPYSVIQVNLHFTSGVIGSFTFFCAGVEMQRPLIGLRIFGTGGMIYLEERDAGTINVTDNDGHLERIPYEVQKGYYNELVNFYEALTSGKPIKVTAEVEYGDLQAVMDIMKSIEEEKVMRVEETGVVSPT